MGFYFPDLSCRLFSPQVLLSELHAARGGDEAEQDAEKDVPFSSTSSSCTPTFSVQHGRACLDLPGGKVTFPINRASRLPILHAFADVDLAARGLGMTSCVTAETNQNLTFLQRTLLRWHHRLGHLGFSQVKKIGSMGILGTLGQRFAGVKVTAPKCASCQYGKQERRPKPGKTSQRVARDILKRE